MKRILITGANSYIGTSFENYIKKNYPENYTVDTVDMQNENWKDVSFSEYDCVFHVAGIAHQKETKKNAHLYYQVNRDIAILVAEKAKADGVGQFIFLSSMSVYGMDTGVITPKTKPNPKSHYGKSKWQAEQELDKFSDDNFKVCVLRPPMVYGNGCKGNFQTVVKIVKKTPIFPNVKNERSMIYIDNLSSFIKWCIDCNATGIYFPQNKEYMSTKNMAFWISEALQKKIYFEYITGIVVRILRHIYPTAKKAFGTLIYDTEDKREYCIVSEADSVKESVNL